MPHCINNYSGSSQSMEPEAAKQIWARWTEKRKLCYNIFIGDGDSKSYNQVSQMNPYKTLAIHIEECLVHVSNDSKRLLPLWRNLLPSILTSSTNLLVCPKPIKFLQNYTTVILQNRGKSPADLYKRPSIFLSHVSRIHSTFPNDSCCRCNQTSITAKPPPTNLINYTKNELAKVREVFEIYSSEEFCLHLTFGLTQNANESLQKVVRNFCPKQSKFYHRVFELVQQ